MGYQVLAHSLKCASWGLVRLGGHNLTEIQGAHRIDNVAIWLAVHYFDRQFLS